MRAQRWQNIAYNRTVALPLFLMTLSGRAGENLGWKIVLLFPPYTSGRKDAETISFALKGKFVWELRSFLITIRVLSGL